MEKQKIDILYFLWIFKQLVAATIRSSIVIVVFHNGSLHYVWLQNNQGQVNIRVCKFCKSVNSAGDIYFYQMSLSQSESTILHERIILMNIILSCKIVDSDWLREI